MVAKEGVFGCQSQEKITKLFFKDCLKDYLVLDKDEFGVVD